MMHPVMPIAAEANVDIVDMTTALWSLEAAMTRADINRPLQVTKNAPQTGHCVASW